MKPSSKGELDRKQKLQKVHFSLFNYVIAHILYFRVFNYITDFIITVINPASISARFFSSIPLGFKMKLL
jgi:hypothetical protein